MPRQCWRRPLTAGCCCRLAPYLGRKIGGQGAVVFAQHNDDAAKHYAVKFIFSAKAFEIENLAAHTKVRLPHACGRHLPCYATCPMMHTPAAIDPRRFVTSFPKLALRTAPLDLTQRSPRVRVLHPCVRVTLDASSAADGAPAVQELRDLMPPVEMIVGDKIQRAAATACMPPPLNRMPLPPVIATEKGESLDDFVARAAPDFFTSLQVCPASAARLLWLRHPDSTMHDTCTAREAAGTVCSNARPQSANSTAGIGGGVCTPKPMRRVCMHAPRRSHGGQGAHGEEWQLYTVARVPGGPRQIQRGTGRRSCAALWDMHVLAGRVWDAAALCSSSFYWLSICAVCVPVCHLRRPVRWHHYGMPLINLSQPRGPPRVSTCALTAAR